jgi:hypothetical protein
MRRINLQNYFPRNNHDFLNRFKHSRYNFFQNLHLIILEFELHGNLLTLDTLKSYLRLRSGKNKIYKKSYL